MKTEMNNHPSNRVLEPKKASEKPIIKIVRFDNTRSNQ